MEAIQISKQFKNCLGKEMVTLKTNEQITRYKKQEGIRSKSSYHHVPNHDAMKMRVKANPRAF